MTVYSPDVSIAITGDGVTVDFPIAFPFMAANDIIVLLNNAAGVPITPPPTLGGLNPYD